MNAGVIERIAVSEPPKIGDHVHSLDLAAKNRRLARRTTRIGQIVAFRGKDAIVLGYRACCRDRSMLSYTVRASPEVFVQASRTGGPFGVGFEDTVENSIWLEAVWRSIANSTPASVDRLIRVKPK